MILPLKTSLAILLTFIASPFTAISFTRSAHAEVDITEKPIEYKEGDTVLEGFVAKPKHLKKNAPGIVIVHEWMGLDSYSKKRARMLAELGYIAFAADIYGKGVRPKNTDEAGKLATKYKSDTALYRKRLRAAIDSASQVPGVDPKRMAVIGYCFGGTGALEAARAKMPVLGVASFHGGLSTPNPKETKDITAHVLVMHGADDPTISAEEIKTFQDEMRTAKADWEFISYGNAVHRFSNPEAIYTPGSAMGYNEKADRRSWATLQGFFDEIFKE